MREAEPKRELFRAEDGGKDADRGRPLARGRRDAVEATTETGSRTGDPRGGARAGDGAAGAGERRSGEAERGDEGGHTASPTELTSLPPSSPEETTGEERSNARDESGGMADSASRMAAMAGRSSPASKISSCAAAPEPAVAEGRLGEATCSGDSSSSRELRERLRLRDRRRWRSVSSPPSPSRPGASPPQQTEQAGQQGRSPRPRCEGRTQHR